MVMVSQSDLMQVGGFTLIYTATYIAALFFDIVTTVLTYTYY